MTEREQRMRAVLAEGVRRGVIRDDDSMLALIRAEGPPRPLREIKGARASMAKGRAHLETMPEAQFEAMMREAKTSRVALAIMRTVLTSDAEWDALEARALQ